MKYLIFIIVLFSLSTIGLCEKVLPTSQAIVCRDANHSIKSAELYDYYEARTLRGIIVNLGAPNLSANEKALLALDRLKKFDPKRFSIYRNRISSFPNTILLKSDIEIDGEEYSGDMMYPVNCRIENVLKIVKNNELPEDKKYLVNADIWNAFDNDSKAGLMLHEIMLEWNVFTLNYKIVKRFYARAFNSYLAANILKDLTKSEYDSLLATIQYGSIW